VETNVPTRLKKEPLIEAIWEIRFSNAATAVSELLPGILYRSWGAPRVVRLPTADIPSPIIEADPNLRYVPKIRLESENRAVQIGDRAISLSQRRPYSGWSAFSEDIRQLWAVVRNTGLLPQLERFSLKYIDLISLPEPKGLACLNLKVELGEHEVSNRPVQLRAEIEQGEFAHIIHIASPAEVTLPGLLCPLKGVLVDIDTVVALGGADSWDRLDHELDAAHAAGKVLFFGLLTADTLAYLEPEY
jgi:uncharacterized protein (TIGR04255 family)